MRTLESVHRYDSLLYLVNMVSNTVAVIVQQSNKSERDPTSDRLPHNRFVISVRRTKERDDRMESMRRCISDVCFLLAKRHPIEWQLCKNVQTIYFHLIICVFRISRMRHGCVRMSRNLCSLFRWPNVASFFCVLVQPAAERRKCFIRSFFLFLLLFLVWLSYKSFPYCVWVEHSHELSHTKLDIVLIGRQANRTIRRHFVRMQMKS